VRSITILLVAALVTGCATKIVRQSDLDAWRGVPVIALDTHSLLLTFPMVRTITESGLEIRIYSERINVSSCHGGGEALPLRSGGPRCPPPCSMRIRVASRGWWAATVCFTSGTARYSTPKSWTTRGAVPRTRAIGPNRATNDS
jgi:hypothetical protein